MKSASAAIYAQADRQLLIELGRWIEKQNKSTPRVLAVAVATLINVTRDAEKVAEWLGCSRSTAQRWSAMSNIPKVASHREWLVSKISDKIVELVDASQERAPPLPRRPGRGPGGGKGPQRTP